MVKQPEFYFFCNRYKTSRLRDVIFGLRFVCNSTRNTRPLNLSQNMHMSLSSFSWSTLLLWLQNNFVSPRLHQFQWMLDPSLQQWLVWVFILSQVDFCNAVFVAGLHDHAHITVTRMVATLAAYRIRYKLSLLMYSVYKCTSEFRRFLAAVYSYLQTPAR